MKVTGSQKAKTGIFIVVSFLMLILIIYFIGKQKNLFTSTFHVRSQFQNVSGLQIGNFVRFDGINIGTVDDISIQNDTTVNVVMTLKESVRRFLRADSKASIGTDGLMGDKLIQIAAGTDNAGPLKNNQLAGINPPNMSEIMAKIEGITTNAQVITDNLAGLIYKLNNGQGSLGQLLNSDQLGKSIESTAASANRAVNSINQAASGLNQNMNAVKHSFLLRGYFKRKAKRLKEDSTKKAESEVQDSLKTTGK